MRKKRLIYLDYNATSPIHPEVREAIMPFLTEKYGNPSSIHTMGRHARKAIEEAREEVAKLLGCLPSEIVFTSSGTEANNLAIKGVMFELLKRGKKHLVTTSVEHSSVYEVARYLEKKGFSVTFVEPYGDGYIDENKILNAIREDTALVSVMYLNNETGVVFPVEKIGRALNKLGILFHVDAVQAAGKFKINVRKIGASLLSISGHKMYSMKGAGALYVKKETPLEPLIHGGHHERGIRAGTLAVPAIVALGKACQVAIRDFHQMKEHVEKLGKLLYEKITDIDGAVVNGDCGSRYPGTLNVSFSGVDGETLLMALDLEGVQVSTGSACASGTSEPSRVLAQMKLPKERVRGAIRISIGRFTTEEEIHEAAQIIKKTVYSLRKKGTLR